MSAILATPTVTTVTPRAMMRACVERGLDPGRISAAAGFDSRVLIDPGARVPATQVNSLWQQARLAAGDDAIAIEAAEQLPIGSYRVFDYLLLSSHNMREGFQHVIDCYPLLNGAFRFSLHAASKQLYFDLRRADGATQLPLLYVLFIFATVQVRLRHMLGCVPVMREFRFTAPPVSSALKLQEWFGAPLRFGQPRNEIVMEPALLAQRSLHADAALCEVLQAHARDLLHAVGGGDDFLKMVRSAAALSLNSRAGLASVAKQMATSPRSLQRRLAEQGTSFRQLMDDVRRERCHVLLRKDGTDLAEISFELGFSEPSAFHRAFRRWTGTTPGALLQ